MIRMGCEAILTLQIQGPLLVHSAEPGPWGLDAIALRSIDDHLLIPGDQIQGKIRESMEQIGGESDDWVSERQTSRPPENAGASTEPNGETSGQATTSQIQILERNADRYPLFVSDFRSNDPFRLQTSESMTSVAIDAQTGAASKGQLRIVDCPLKIGEVQSFTGAIRFLCADQSEADRQVQNYVRALRWAISCGSQKSTGWGSIIDVEVKEQARTEFQTAAAARTNYSWPLAIDLEFQDPVCVPSGRIDANLYETQNHIPGEAIRGAVAGLLNRIAGQDKYTQDFPEAAKQDDFPFNKLCTWFDRIRITTARPVKRQTLPSDDTAAVPLPAVLPLSAAFGPDNQLIDASMAKSEDELSNGIALTFSPDWKFNQWELANQQFGITAPQTELRVHTAIDSTRRRAAESQLYGVQSLQTSAHVWRCSISIDARSTSNDKIDDRRTPDDESGSAPTPSDCQQAIQQLESLLNLGWLSVSRTRARARGIIREIAAPPQDSSAPVPIDVDDKQGVDAKQEYVITLRGPSLMLAPWEIVDDSGCLKSESEIDTAWEQFWHTLSDESLLEVATRRFKLDEMIGGFQARRYRYDPTMKLGDNADLDQRIRSQRQLPYNPTLLVQAGSVFVLQVKNGKTERAKQKIEEWLRYGLPLPKWARKAYGSTHHTNVFLPQNGYGEISVNLPFPKATNPSRANAGEEQ